MSDTKGFQTVEQNIEEMNEQIRSHRKKVARRIICVAGILIVIFVAAELYLALRTFSSYRVNSTIERHDSEAVSFINFGNYILKYSNDGAVCTDGQNEQIWNQSYEMVTPTVTICEDYVAIYDRGGIDVYILSKTNTIKHLEMGNPISTVSISSGGTIAVLMKDTSTSYVEVYNKAGDKLVHGGFPREEGTYPVDIALSQDAKKFAVSMLDISEGNLKSIINFYNFGSVGKNEIDNKVGEFVYEDMMIPEIEFVTNNRMIALADKEIMIFEGAEKPDLSEEIIPESEIRSAFYNDKYVGIVTENDAEKEGYHITLYNSKGRSSVDVDTKIEYTDIYFLNNGEFCVTDGIEVEIYTSHSIKKFKYEFDRKLLRILSQGKGSEYVFVFEDATEEVRLR